MTTAPKWLLGMALGFTSSASLAQPLEFAGFTADSTRQSSRNLVQCIGPSLFCSLTRDHLADRRIIASKVSYATKTDKIEFVEASFDTINAQIFVDAFTAKYGPPRFDELTKKPGAELHERLVYWRFDNKASVDIHRNDDGIVIRAVWLNNFDAPTPPKVDF